MWKRLNVSKNASIYFTAQVNLTPFNRIRSESKGVKGAKGVD